MKEIEELCDYIYILNDGTLIKKGTAKELAEDTFNRKDYVLKLYEQKASVIKFLEEKLSFFDPTIVVSTDQEGIYINSSENISLELSRLCTQERFIIREMFEKEPRLEDTILQLSKEVAK
ncbi:MAG: natA [Herbinix sp.]|jgi:ABC-2 type transport system ATP-binding protein|nr:natA [Herbinix sp.]